MADRELATILSRIRRTVAEVGGVSDAQLLGRFAASRDEAAFELLLWRHARLVLGVCRRVLHDLHDAEDAFQATFLALARQARRIDKCEAVAGWLYKVAYRVALTARAKRSKRRERSLQRADEQPAPPDAATPAECADLRAVLDEEVSRLPERLRAPVVLCYLEDKTVDEAALLLGCPRGTVASRLARARERLRMRLTRRGLALTAGLAAISRAGAAPRPLSLIAPLIRTALHGAHAGAVPGPAVSLKAVTLTEEVLRAMFFHKLQAVTLVVVACAGVLLAGGWAVHLHANARPEQAQPAPAAPANDADHVGRQRADDVTRPRSVAVSQPARRKAAPYEDFTGRLEALHTVKVRSRVSGLLDHVLVKAGADVKKGDVLFDIDPRTYQAAIDKAQTDLALAEARKKSKDAELRRARDAAEAIPRQSLDEIANQAAAADAAVKAARAAVERVRLSLEATKISAATDGRVGLICVDPGNDVFEGDKPILLTTITRLDPISLFFNMDERSYLRYQRLLRGDRVKGAGSPLLMAVSDEDGFPHRGTLDSFDNQVNPDSGTIRVRGIFPNPGRLLLPGMFARVRMGFGPPRSVLEVPESAVGTDGSKRFVLVVNEGNRVARRDVTLGQRDDGMRIIERGLDRSAWVVTSEINRLPVGDRVKPQRQAPGKE